MFILFLFFWAIAFFILMNEFRTIADIWIAIAIFCFGFIGMSAFLQAVDVNMKNYWFLPTITESVAMLWGIYALLMYAMHYVGKMPKRKTSQRMIELLCAIPLIVFCFIIPVIHIFGLQETKILLEYQKIFMTGIITPYFVVMIVLLTRNLYYKRKTLRHSENVRSYILVIPIASICYVTVFILPFLGYYDLWHYRIGAIIAEAVLFFILVIQKNAFGLFYYQKNATQEYLEKSIIEGTGVLQHAMKNNLLAVRLSLQNAQYHYRKNNQDLEVIHKNIQLAYSSCKHSQAILKRTYLKIHPVQIALKNDTLLPLIMQVIEQCQTDNSENIVQISIESESNPQVYCDPVHIREVILNLVNNAMEATSENEFGRIFISLAKEREKVVIQIRDNGCGVENEQLKKIGTISHSTKAEGTHYGLGLYYVKKIIRMHEGQFSLRKDGNGGMIARIVLPLAQR